MISKIKNLGPHSLILLFAAFVLSVSSCNKKDYPCPGLGQSNEADISMFDEEGKLKDGKDKGRMDRKTGLVKKKKPKKLSAPRKTHL